MGGKEGARGYLYQAFATVVEMLTIDFWHKTYIEFKTENDKVDIAIEFENQIIKAIQVKSSINLIQRTEILNWLRTLVDDCESKEYELILIGGLSKPANTLVKSLEKFKQGEIDKETKSVIDSIEDGLLEHNISVKVIPFDERSLQSIVRDNLNKYISQKGAVVKYDGLVMISNSINMTMMLLSSKSAGITKEELDVELFNWITTVMGSYINVTKESVKHIVGIYNDELGDIELDSSNNELRNSNAFTKFIGKNKIIVDNIVAELKSYNISKHIDTQIVSDDTPLSEVGDESIFKKIGSLVKFKSLELSDDTKAMLLKEINVISDLECDESLFYLGDLKESTFNFGGLGDTEVIGSDEEKKKHELINELYFILMKTKFLRAFIDDIGGLQMLKVAVKNIGTMADSDLRIQLYVPKEIGIYNTKGYKGNDYIPTFADYLIEEDGLFDELFRISSDRNLVIEKEKTLPVYTPPIDFQLLGYKSRPSYTMEQFNNFFEGYFLNNIIDVTNEHVIIEFSVSEIHQNEIKGARKLLLLNKFNGNIMIEYKVFSKKGNGRIVGEFHVQG